MALGFIPDELQTNHTLPSENRELEPPGRNIRTIMNSRELSLASLGRRRDSGVGTPDDRQAAASSVARPSGSRE